MEKYTRVYILIFRSDNLVDFLSRFLIVNRPCELSLNPLLTMQLCGSTSRFIRFLRGDLLSLSLSLSRVMVNEPVLKSFFFSTATRSMYPWFFIYVCETIRKGRCALPWNWTDPWLIYITILGKDYGGEVRTDRCYRQRCSNDFYGWINREIDGIFVNLKSQFTRISPETEWKLLSNMILDK